MLRQALVRAPMPPQHSSEKRGGLCSDHLKDPGVRKRLWGLDGWKQSGRAQVSCDWTSCREMWVDRLLLRLGVIVAPTASK